MGSYEDVTSRKSVEQHGLVFSMQQRFSVSPPTISRSSIEELDDIH